MRETLQENWCSRAIENDVKIIHFLFCQGGDYKGETNKVPKSVKFSSSFPNNSLQEVMLDTSYVAEYSRLVLLFNHAHFRA